MRVRDGKGVKHDGIKVEFVGSIGEDITCTLRSSIPGMTEADHWRVIRAELFYDRGNHYEFLSLVQELATPGELRSAQSFEFEFKNVEKQYESYHGINVKLRYFVRVTVARRIAPILKEKELWVHSFRIPPDSNNSIKMEVGIEDCLHIEFEYNKSK